MKSYFGTAVMGGTVLAAILGCYMVSLRVSSERAAVESLRVDIAADTRSIRLLQAELRTRARLPELERWNNNVLALAPLSERQFVRDPVQLASYAPGAAARAEAPAVATPPRFAVTPPVVSARPVLKQIAYSVPAPARPVTVAAPTMPAAAKPAGIDADLGAVVAAAAAAEAKPAAKAAMQ